MPLEMELSGLQHHEFAPTIPNPPSIDGFDAIPPVLSDDWARLGKELSHCTGTEIVPRENIQAVLLLYGVRHERTVAVANENLRKSRSGLALAETVEYEPIRKFDSSLLLEGVRHEGASAGPAPDDLPAKVESTLSLATLRHELRGDSPNRRGELKRSASLPELNEFEGPPIGSGSFSAACVSDDVSVKWSSMMFDDWTVQFGSRHCSRLTIASDEGSAIPRVTSVRFEPLGRPTSRSLEELTVKAEVQLDVEEEDASPKAFPKIFKSPSNLLFLGPRPNAGRLDASPPESPRPATPPRRERLVFTLPGTHFSPPSPRPPPASPGDTSPAAPAAAAIPAAAAPAASAPAPAPRKGQAVQSLLQLLKPLQDQQSRLRQQQQQRPQRPPPAPRSPESIPCPSPPPPAESTGTDTPPHTAEAKGADEVPLTETQSPTAPTSSTPANEAAGEAPALPAKSQQQQQLLMLLQDQARRQELLRQKRLQQQHTRP